MELTVYHNPRCSKSRQTLALLEQKGIEPRIIEYLNTPPDAGEIRKVLGKLGISARQLLRTGEPEYRALGLDDENLGEDELIAAMAACPRLIQRPIVIKGDCARIGRPPEAVLEIL